MTEGILGHRYYGKRGVGLFFHVYKKPGGCLHQTWMLGAWVHSACETILMAKFSCPG